MSQEFTKQEIIDLVSPYFNFDHEGDFNRPTSLGAVIAVLDLLGIIKITKQDIDE